MCFTFSDEQSDVHHLSQVSLQRTPVDLGAQALELLDGQAAAFQDVSEGLRLALRKAMLVDEDIFSDGLLSALPDLGVVAPPVCAW
jgi:hypothetical protein